jgi:AraC-like DNA-binding protein
MSELVFPIPYLLFLGGACSLVTLSLIKLLVSYRQTLAGRWLALFLVVAIGFALKPVVHQDNTPVHFLLFVCTTLLAPSFWLFCYTLSRESTAVPWLSWLLIAVSVGLHLLAAGGGFGGLQFCLEQQSASCAQPPAPLNYLAYATTVGLFAASVWILVADRAGDMVEARRRLRLVVVIAVGLYLTIAALVVMLFQSTPISPEAISARAFFGLMLGFGMSAWLLGLIPSAVLPTLRHAVVGEDLPGQTQTAAQRQIATDLQTLMASGIYRQAGLSISDLAIKLQIPEHVLRPVINGQLNFRNFSDFVNRHRIDEAALLLRDTHKSAMTVLQIALHVGFGSLSPFNLAFRRRFQCTPSQFRADG